MSATTPANIAPPPPPNPYISFQAGVTATLRSWSALRTAVEQSWGGTESPTKAEDLRLTIFTFFDGTTPKPKMTPEELEDNLLEYMEDEYGVVLEDGSEREIANLIYDMYEMCAKGNVSLAHSVVQNAMKGEEILKQGNVKMSVIQSGEDGDDDMEDDSDVEQDDNAMDNGVEGQQQQPMNDATTTNSNTDVMPTAFTLESYASGYLFGNGPPPPKELPPPRQLGDIEPDKPQPVVDDDGFAPVVTKKKGKK